MKQFTADAAAIDAAKLSSIWDVESLSCGSSRVMQTQDARQRGWTQRLLAASLWNGVVQLFAAGVLGFIPGVAPPERSASVLAALLLLVPFAAVGMVPVYGLAWSIMGHEEWIISRHRMEKRWGWKSSQQRKSRLYADAQGQLELKYHEPGSDSSEYWSLELWCPNNQKNYRAQLGSTSSQQYSCEELRVLGELLSEKSGWPLLLRGKSSKSAR